MSVLIVAEHDGSALTPATLATVTAAKKLSEAGAGEVHVLIAGGSAKAAAEQAAKLPGIAKVKLAEAPHLAAPLAEDLAALVVQEAGAYSHVLAPATTFGKNLLPRAAALKDSQQISDAIAVISVDTFVRPTYAGNALATVQSKDAIKFVTVRGTAFEKAVAEGGSAAIEAVTPPAATALATHQGAEISKSERPELTAAKIIVSGGRGMQSGENFVMIEEIADKLGAAVGASRAAVDAGFKPNDFQVGQTGKIVAPEMYIAVGISGAIQHLAGMKDSKVIVAINKDEEAPMFQVADYGIVGDLFKVLPELSAELDKIKK